MSTARCLALVVLLVSPALAGSAELGPAPRDADGRFTNDVGELSHGTFGIRAPFFLRRIAGTFSARPNAPARLDNDGAFLRENARHSVPTVTWVGHSTLLVQMDHASFLTDPTWSDTASPVSFLGPRRFVPPGLAMDALPPVDFVVVSHSHYDHLDLGTLAELSRRRPETLFLVPMGNADLLRSRGIARVEEMDWGQSREVAGVTVHCLPAQHWSQRSLGDRNATLWSSWAVVGKSRRFYFAGDTGAFDGFARIGRALGPFDLAAVPIGAYEPREMMREAHVNPEEALQAALDLGARRAVGVHFGTFDLSDEPLDDPPRRFLEAAEGTALAGEGAWVLKVGETREF